MKTYIVDDLNFKMIKRLFEKGSLSLNLHEIVPDQFITEASNTDTDMEIISSVSSITSLAIKSKLGIKIAPSTKSITIEPNSNVLIVRSSKVRNVSNKLVTVLSFYKLVV